MQEGRSVMGDSQIPHTGMPYFFTWIETIYTVLQNVLIWSPKVALVYNSRLKNKCTKSNLNDASP